jgi:hypothetical protein
MKIEDFLPYQGLTVEGGKIKTKGEEIKEKIKNKELEEMGYGPNGEILDKKKVKNYDPINRKDYSNELFEKKDEVLYSQEMLDTFSDEDSLYNFINEKGLYVEEENLENNDEKESFEDENIQEYWLNQIKKKKDDTYEISDIYKKMPEYTLFEISEMRRNFEDWLDKINSRFIDSEKLTKSQTLEMVKEFRDNFSTEFTTKINHKILSNEIGEFKWEEEIKNGKKQMVSYYPNKENYSIKYINKDYNLKDLDKIFVNNVFHQNKKNNKKESSIVFCSAPKNLKNKK